MRYRLILTITLIFTAALVLVACGSQQDSPTPTAIPITQTDASEQEEAVHDDDDEHDAVEEEDAAHDDSDEHNEDEEDHGADSHGIPEDAADTPNPIAADAVSIEAGQQSYKASCAVCHGETGLGDGAAGAAMDPPPSNLSADHVQVLSDGALYFTIRNGVEGTGMPAWGEALSEDDIWNIVNFIRTIEE